MRSMKSYSMEGKSDDENQSACMERALCEASAIYLWSFDPNLFGHIFMSISLPHAKIQLHLPSKGRSSLSIKSNELGADTVQKNKLN